MLAKAFLNKEKIIVDAENVYVAPPAHKMKTEHLYNKKQQKNYQ